MSNEKHAELEREVATMEALFHSADYLALEESAREFTNKYPHIGFGWSVLGTALQVQNKDAVAAIEQAVALLPDDPIAHNNLGDALMHVGQHKRAVESYKNAIAINKENAAIHNNLGNALSALREFDLAHASYVLAQQLQPSFAEAYCNQAIAYTEQGRLVPAEACLHKAIQMKPDFALAHFQLGAILKESGRTDEAEASCRTGLLYNPDMAEAHSNHGAILDDLGRVEEAAAAFKRAIQLKPDFAAGHSNLLFHNSHSEHITPGELFKAHQEFAERFEAPLVPHWLPHLNNRDPHRVLRVGFVSGDLRVHAVASFFEPILVHLARCASLSLYAYSNSPYEDSVTQRLRSNIHHWRQIAGMPDEGVAQLVREDGIDILIDLSGHTAYNRLPTFARKPAPIQASWMGYPATTGLRAVDYYIGDPYWLPKGQFESQFSEKIVRLPASAPFMPFKDSPRVNHLPALGQGHLTFGSFNHLRKLNSTVIGVWSQILRALPNARMLLGAMPNPGENPMLAELFINQGIARERLSFYPKAQMKDYLELHHQVDICLDTFPYPGGTTSCHSLSMGVPTITLIGESPVKRAGALLLNHVGLPQFIAIDVADYVAKSIYWSTHLAELAAIREGLRSRFANSPMCQPDAIAASVEYALRKMWHQWCAGCPSTSFEVTELLKQQALQARTN